MSIATILYTAETDSLRESVKADLDAEDPEIELVTATLRGKDAKAVVGGLCPKDGGRPGPTRGDERSRG